MKQINTSPRPNCRCCGKSLRKLFFTYYIPGVDDPGARFTITQEAKLEAHLKNYYQAQDFEMHSVECGGAGVGKDGKWVHQNIPSDVITRVRIWTGLYGYGNYVIKGGSWIFDKSTNVEVCSTKCLKAYAAAAFQANPNFRVQHP